MPSTRGTTKPDPFSGCAGRRAANASATVAVEAYGISPHSRASSASQSPTSSRGHVRRRREHDGARLHDVAGRRSRRETSPVPPSPVTRRPRRSGGRRSGRQRGDERADQLAQAARQRSKRAVAAAGRWDSPAGAAERAQQAAVLALRFDEARKQRTAPTGDRRRRRECPRAAARRGSRRLRAPNRRVMNAPIDSSLVVAPRRHEQLRAHAQLAGPREQSGPDETARPRRDAEHRRGGQRDAAARRAG